MQPSTLNTAPERTGDPPWGIAVGLYLALLAAPPAAFAVAEFSNADAGVLYGTVVTTLAVVTGVGWGATARWSDGGVRLGATRLRWLLGVLPTGYALLGFASLVSAGALGALAFFFGLFAAILGLVLGVMSRTRYTAAVLGDVVVDCEFRAGWPESAKRRVGRITLSLVVTALVCFAVAVLRQSYPFQYAAQILLPAGIVLYTATEPRTYAATPAGLEHRLPVARRLFQWDDFDGYTRTSDALVLRRPRRVDLRLALADLDDPDAVETAIGRYLPTGDRRD